MRPPRTELNLTEWIGLALASEAPIHGWTAVRALRRDGLLGQVWSTSGPLVYRAISRLQEAGLLQSVGIAEGQGPNRVLLEAMPAGREQVREWLLEPVGHVRDVRTLLLVKLLLLQRRGEDPVQLVRDQRERLRPVATALAERAAAASGPDRVVAEWRALNTDAVMRFLDALDAASVPGPAQHPPIARRRRLAPAPDHPPERSPVTPRARRPHGPQHEERLEQQPDGSRSVAGESEGIDLVHELRDVAGEDQHEERGGQPPDGDPVAWKRDEGNAKRQLNQT